jgi:hypothetical protein
VPQRALCPEFPDSRRWVTRVIGGRTVLQSALVLARPTRERLLTGAAVDAAHAVSMLLALPSRRHRCAACASGAVAAASAVLAGVAARGVSR